MVISFNPKYRLGDIVYPKIDDENTMVVISYCIMAIDETGYVNHYNIGCSDHKGDVNYFRPYELELFSEVEKEK